MLTDNNFYVVLTYALNNKPLSRPVSLNPPLVDSSRDRLDKI